MSCRLSVNLNKIALLRNQRDLTYPSVVSAAKTVIAAGANGITVHPRPDERHIRKQDARDLATLLQAYPDIEYNIEGNPFESDWLELVKTLKPQQATLVPDDPNQATSDHGWSSTDSDRLKPVVESLQSLGIRVSLFMDADDLGAISQISKTGADRIELYTEPYAAALDQDPKRADVFPRTLNQFAEAAKAAESAGMNVNAGHDLSLANLRPLALALPNLKEVSIGHAFIADALWQGLHETTKQYLTAITP